MQLLPETGGRILQGAAAQSCIRQKKGAAEAALFVGGFL
jgi:hypothetical protein